MLDTWRGSCKVEGEPGFRREQQYREAREQGEAGQRNRARTPCTQLRGGNARPWRAGPTGCIATGRLIRRRWCDGVAQARAAKYNTAADARQQSAAGNMHEAAASQELVGPILPERLGLQVGTECLREIAVV